MAQFGIELGQPGELQALHHGLQRQVIKFEVAGHVLRNALGDVAGLGSGLSRRVAAGVEQYGGANQAEGKGDAADADQAEAGAQADGQPLQYFR